MPRPLAAPVQELCIWERRRRADETLMRLAPQRILDQKLVRETLAFQDDEVFGTT